MTVEELMQILSNCSPKKEVNLAIDAPTFEGSLYTENVKVFIYDKWDQVVIQGDSIV